MKRGLGAVALALAVAAAAGCSGSADRLKTTQAETRIATAVSESLLIKTTAARCPDGIELKQGRSFLCTVTVEGKSLSVKAIQTNDAGDLRIEPQAAVVRTDQVQADLLDRLTKQFGRPFTADCGAAATRILKPGTTFTCQAADATSKRVVTVEIKDAKGTITYDVGGTTPKNGGTTTTTTTVPPDPNAPLTMVPATTAPTTVAPTTRPGTTAPATAPPTTAVPTTKP